MTGKRVHEGRPTCNFGAGVRLTGDLRRKLGERYLGVKQELVNVTERGDLPRRLTRGKKG